jgi:hypothetical protein
MVSPVHGDYRRCQAEIPLIVLCRFPGPALAAPLAIYTTEEISTLSTRLPHKLDPALISRRLFSIAIYVVYRSQIIASKTSVQIIDPMMMP